MYFKVDYLEESSKDTVLQFITNEHNRISSLMSSKDSLTSNDPPEYLKIIEILKGLEGVKELETQFQSQVIDSHKDIWEALDYRRTPCSPPQEIIISVPL